MSRGALLINGYAVHSYYRYYHLIRQSERYSLISSLSYTASLTSIRPSPLWLLILSWLSPFIRRRTCWVHFPNSSSTISVIDPNSESWRPQSPQPEFRVGVGYDAISLVRFHCDLLKIACSLSGSKLLLLGFQLWNHFHQLPDITTVLIRKLHREDFHLLN